MNESSESPVWSGTFPTPAVGDPVSAHVGSGVVVGHAVVDGFLGLLVDVTEPAEWYRLQCDTSEPALVFGAELRDAPGEDGLTLAEHAADEEAEAEFLASFPDVS